MSLALALLLPLPCAAQTLVFDFDSGTPVLAVGQGTPFTQGKGGVALQLTSPTFGAGGFSIQTVVTTHYVLSQFSGNFVYPNSTANAALDIRSSVPLVAISLTFATGDFNQAELPSTLALTAYVDSTTTPAVGSVSAQGTYGPDTMPMGTIAFSSPTKPFNLVELQIQRSPYAAGGFLVDNVRVTPVSHVLRRHLRRM